MIEVKNLVKKYGSHTAVNDVSFDVNDGEILGFLGPNGAGKSTTMNILTGYLSATNGEVVVDGFNILDKPQEAKKKLGYLPEQPPLYMDMLVDEYLEFVCDLKAGELKTSAKKSMIAEICESVRITDVRKRLIKNLSKGYKQRVGLAQAMIGYPDVLILDEPTVGLDPKQIIEMRNVIKGLGKKHTIILSSHILPEISAVCDRVMIINKGKIVASDTPSNLSKNLNKGDKMMLRVKGTEHDIMDCLRSVPLFKNIDVMGSYETGTFDVLVEGNNKDDIREALFFALSKNKLPILTMKSNDLSLEEIFLQVTTGNSSGNESEVRVNESNN